jgi:hypothetical protein
MAHLAKWFIVLGTAALLPAAVLLGGSIGEVMRHPSLGRGEILQHELQLVVLAVVATFLLSTAAGLAQRRRWALLLGIAEAGLLPLAGAVLLVGNASLVGALGMPQILGLGAIMLGLAALIAGAHLLRSLWQALATALPFGRADLRALGGLAAVILAAALGHLLATGIAA